MSNNNDDDSYIDNLFNDVSNTQEAQSEEAPKVESKEAEQPQRTEEEADTQKSETEAEPLSGVEDGQEKEEELTEQSWTKSAVLDERRKRQEYEKRVKELEAKILESNSEQKQVEESKKAPDPIDDPEAFAAHQDDRMFALALKFDQRHMQEKHKDYEDTVEHFKKMAGSNAALIETFKKQEFPATYAYNTAKADLNAIKFSDPNYESNLREQIKQELLAELKKESVETVKTSSSKVDASSLPKLNNVAAATSNTEPKIEVDDKNIGIHFGDLGY